MKTDTIQVCHSVTMGNSPGVTANFSLHYGKRSGLVRQTTNTLVHLINSSKKFVVGASRSLILGSGQDTLTTAKHQN